MRDKEKLRAKGAERQRNREAAGQQPLPAAAAVGVEGKPPPAAVVVSDGCGGAEKGAVVV